MPLITQSVVGSRTVASANANREITISQTADGVTTDTLILASNQQPHLFFWVNQTVGAIGQAVTPQFAVRMGGAPVAPVFNNLSGPQIVPVGAPMLLEFYFPCRFIRLRLGPRPAGQLTTLTIILGCCAT